MTSNKQVRISTPAVAHVKPFQIQSVFTPIGQTQLVATPRSQVSLIARPTGQTQFEAKPESQASLVATSTGPTQFLATPGTTQFVATSGTYLLTRPTDQTQVEAQPETYLLTRPTGQANFLSTSESQASLVATQTCQTQVEAKPGTYLLTRPSGQTQTLATPGSQASLVATPTGPTQFVATPGTTQFVATPGTYLLTRPTGQTQVEAKPGTSLLIRPTGQTHILSPPGSQAPLVATTTDQTQVEAKPGTYLLTRPTGQTNCLSTPESQASLVATQTCQTQVEAKPGTYLLTRPTGQTQSLATSGSQASLVATPTGPTQFVATPGTTQFVATPGTYLLTRPTGQTQVEAKPGTSLLTRPTGQTGQAPLVPTTTDQTQVKAKPETYLLTRPTGQTNCLSTPESQASLVATQTCQTQVEAKPATYLLTRPSGQTQSLATPGSQASLVATPTGQTVLLDNTSLPRSQDNMTLATYRIVDVAIDGVVRKCLVQTNNNVSIVSGVVNDSIPNNSQRPVGILQNNLPGSTQVNSTQAHTLKLTKLHAKDDPVSSLMKKPVLVPTQPLTGSFIQNSQSQVIATKTALTSGSQTCVPSAPAIQTYALPQKQSFGSLLTTLSKKAIPSSQPLKIVSPPVQSNTTVTKPSQSTSNTISTPNQTVVSSRGDPLSSTQGTDVKSEQSTLLLKNKKTCIVSTCTIPIPHDEVNTEEKPEVTQFIMNGKLYSMVVKKKGTVSINTLSNAAGMSAATCSDNSVFVKSTNADSVNSLQVRNQESFQQNAKVTQCTHDELPKQWYCSTVYPTSKPIKNISVLSPTPTNSEEDNDMPLFKIESVVSLAEQDEKRTKCETSGPRDQAKGHSHANNTQNDSEKEITERAEQSKQEIVKNTVQSALESVVIKQETDESYTENKKKDEKDNIHFNNKTSANVLRGDDHQVRAAQHIVEQFKNNSDDSTVKSKETPFTSITHTSESELPAEHLEFDLSKVKTELGLDLKDASYLYSTTEGTPKNHSEILEPRKNAETPNSKLDKKLTESKVSVPTDVVSNQKRKGDEINNKKPNTCFRAGCYNLQNSKLMNKKMMAELYKLTHCKVVLHRLPKAKDEVLQWKSTLQNARSSHLSLRKVKFPWERKNKNKYVSNHVVVPSHPFHPFVKNSSGMVGTDESIKKEDKERKESQWNRKYNMIEMKCQDKTYFLNVPQTSSNHLVSETVPATNHPSSSKATNQSTSPSDLKPPTKPNFASQTNTHFTLGSRFTITSTGLVKVESVIATPTSDDVGEKGGTHSVPTKSVSDALKTPPAASANKAIPMKPIKIKSEASGSVPMDAFVASAKAIPVKPKKIKSESSETVPMDAFVNLVAATIDKPQPATDYSEATSTTMKQCQEERIRILKEKLRKQEAALNEIRIHRQKRKLDDILMDSDDSN